MNKFLTVSSLMLFWAFFEMSGGMDFVPASEQETAETEVAVATDDRFNFQDVYVPFSDPIVTSPLDAVASVEPAEVPTDIVQASFTTASATEIAPLASTTEVAADAPRADIRIVAGNRVNMRSGPSTGFDVIATLPRGVEAEVLQVNADDWAEIRLLESGETGWMAAWLLSD